MPGSAKSKAVWESLNSFEKQIRDTACVLRSNLDASEYRSVVLGLIFLEQFSKIEKEGSEDGGDCRARRRTQVGWHPSRTTTQPCDSRTAGLFSVFLRSALAVSYNFRLVLTHCLLFHIFAVALLLHFATFFSSWGNSKSEISLFPIEPSYNKHYIELFLCALKEIHWLQAKRGI